MGDIYEGCEAIHERAVVPDVRIRGEGKALPLAELAPLVGRVREADVLACIVALHRDGTIGAQEILVAGADPVEAQPLSVAIPRAGPELAIRPRFPCRAYP